MVPGTENRSVDTYWGVEEVNATYTWLIEQGAVPEAALHEVGGGIRLGTVRDPSGNVLGVIVNLHVAAQS